ncbi:MULTISPECIES: phytoene desaturase family protein [Paenibacillus]|uniref:phytoene desaturase family protein n=1 Tax=Paenibacillus TaxID=44249 RepID=UPI0022B92E84|nr:NAD(P)/FAD-dependent oxidoreductase [Paenibacillus caseinilyticus]MCZ8522424.1 NAD(P)/FAD-dependent oxidoreductase [Paenibacillus caseinilyticus]
MEQTNTRYDSIVIGGGLTGLTAAVFLARAGQSVMLLEKAKNLGGLAQTTDMNGAKFNLGPHAMYEGGAALRILRELDCLPEGGYASKKGLIGISQGQLIHVPGDLTSEENEEWTGLMGGLGRIDTESIASLSVQEWSNIHIRYERVRLLFQAMCRQWSFCSDMSSLSCGFAVRQGQLAGQGVRYVEGGWHTVVEKLRSEASQAGATILSSRRADRILASEDSVTGVRLSDGTAIEASSVILAAGPNEACRLVDGSEAMSLGQWRDACRPLYAACLDVALMNPPHPEHIFALGLGEPYYYSNHSVSVKLSDNGAQVLHLMKYLDPGDPINAKANEQELHGLLDLLQPGWEEEVTAKRFLPKILVAHDWRSIRHQGDGPAPGPVVPEIGGLYVAGDWVGREGRLADGAMSSAKLAVQEIVRRA